MQIVESNKAFMNNRKISNSVRVYHRYLGFFLAGIMAIYAVSGMVMIFRNTDVFKIENHLQVNIGNNLSGKELGQKLKIRNLKVQKEENDVLYFKNGKYNKQTGVANYTTKQLPYFLNKLTKLHKANTNSKLYYLNIFFGLCLLFFVLSAFWMFLPSTKIFRKGIFFTVGGILLALILIFV